MERTLANHSILGLEALAAVAETKSLAKAGQLLGVTGSAISKQLTRLEQHLGVRLLRRTTRSVALSPAGGQLANEYVKSRAILESAMASVQQDGKEPQGVLRISAPPAFGIHVLPKILKEFVRNYPKVTVDLDLTGRLVNVSSEGFDVAIRITGAPPQDYVAVEIAPVVWGIYGSRTYLSSHGTPRSAAQLRNHSFISTSTRASTYRLEVSRRTGFETVTLTPILLTRSVEATYALVTENIGLGVLPDYLAHSGNSSEQLQRVLPNCTVISERGNRIHALMLPGRSLRPAARSFVEFLHSKACHSTGSKLVSAVRQ